MGEESRQSRLFPTSHPNEVAANPMIDLRTGPFADRTDFVIKKIAAGAWREGVLPAADAGLSRDLPIFLAARKTSPVVHDWHGDHNTYCPPLYWDLAIGSGACGLGCRGCYLMGTFRDRRDPHQPLVYDNVAFIWEAVRRWLISPKRRSIHTLGLGTDRSDSLLFESITGHARQVIPMFADNRRNILGCKLFLLTKSKNVHYLEGLPTTNSIVTFSLNPQPIADLWEGRWPDTLDPIPPTIDERLAASLETQRMGFEVRWRIDPILTPDGWEEAYRSFFSSSASSGHRPSRITLGTYRETTSSLDHWRRRWGVPAMDWRPARLSRDGTHRNAPESYRIATYAKIAAMCARFHPESIVSLCKETRSVRMQTGIASPSCNCLNDLPGGSRERSPNQFFVPVQSILENISRSPSA